MTYRRSTSLSCWGSVMALDRTCYLSQDQRKRPDLWFG